MTSKEQVDELFTRTVDDWARFYADPKPVSLNSQNLISRRRFALEMIEARVPPGSKVLDIGCGTGHLAGELMRRGYEAWGVDFSDAMVRYAREHYDADRFQVGDIERIPFPDNSFDGVMSLGVMEYLSADEPALREMWRVLKPGGRAVITTPSSICPFYYMDRAAVKVGSLARPLVRFVRHRLRGRPLTASRELPSVTHRRYYRRRWVKLMRSVGLETEDWACHSWGCYSLERFFNQGAFCRASDRFARNPLLNWLASDQLACVRAVK
ncbi:MAG TPA: class I SAM-dependent methyltransferase [Terriglobales bacterium]|nr:class I SAM-dependent methyltransferase [Terriglobales bacterium]